MPRTRRYSPFEKRTNRLRLPADTYHGVTVGDGVKLYYRRGKKRSTWYVRRADQDGQRALGTADDFQDADGVNVLDYFAAVKLALARVEESVREDRPLAARGGHTVRDAGTEYVARLRSDGKKSITETQRIIDKDIVPQIGSTPLVELTERALRDWRTALLNAPRRIRGGKLREIDASPEGQRRAKSTTQRKWNVLRAVLNCAASKQWIDPRVWAGIGNLEDIDPPHGEFPTMIEIRRLLRHVPKEFRAVVEATFLCGGAFGELRAMKCRDYTPSTGHIRVFNSKRRPRHIPLTKDGTALFDALTAGRNADDFIFKHPTGRAWMKSEQHRPMQDANALAKLDPPITLTRLRHAYGSLLLNAGVPLSVVSTAMGHSTPEVTRKHYARLLQGTIDDEIRKALPKIGKRATTRRIA